MRRLLLLALFLPALALGQATRIIASDSVQSGCVLNAANATCVLPMAGKSTAGFVVTAISSPVGMTLVNETSRDPLCVTTPGSAAWDGKKFLDMDYGGGIDSIPNTSLAAGFGKTLVLGGGIRCVRVKASAWTSGSVTVTVTATDTSADMSWAPLGQVASTTQPTAVQQEGAWVTTAAPSYGNATLQPFSMTPAGDQRIISKIHDGTNIAAVKAASTAAATADPALVVSFAAANSATKIGDGTNNAAIKAASTAAAATDPALVVTQNPLGGNACKNPSATLAMISGSTSGTASVQLVALAASQRIYVCSMVVIGTSGTTPTFSLTYGTGTACATGNVVIVGAFTTTANALFNFSNPFAVTTAGQALCYVQTGTTPISRYVITYVQAP